MKPVKPVSDRAAKRRLLQLADFLENLPNGQFDFSTFGDVSGGETGDDALEKATLCGTTAGALGWAPALPFAKRLGFKLEVRTSEFYGSFAEFTKNGRVVETITVAKQLFGLSADAMKYIFHSSVLNENGKNNVHTVANGIRDFVTIRFG